MLFRSKAPLHHGKVIFHEIDNKHPIDIHLIDRGMQMFDAHNIFPEYFLISIPLFDDVIKAEIDEWLYLMKHSEVKDDFKSPYMKKAAERLSILKMSNQEREVYDTYVMDSMKGRDYLISAEAKGKAEGISIGEARGEKKKAVEIARVMLAKNKSVEEIEEFTGLSKEEIARIWKRL